MKSTIQLLALSLLIALSSSAQQQLEPTGGGQYSQPNGLCVTPEQRVDIESDIRTSRNSLIERGLLSNEPKGGSVLMNFPLAMAPGSDWNAGYAISGYVDQDLTAGIQSHHCDEYTYNGHKGTDYFTWPFGGYQMEHELLHIVAAAPGTIVFKGDGHFDQQCDGNTTLIWNAVYVEHSDGTIAWYGHMKLGTLTTKAVGETVEIGEYLGVVGSSGYSTGPHLHFELHNADGTLIDPYFDACNATDLSSTWVDQPPYWEMALNTLLTHDDVMEFGCPAANEEPHIQEYFNSLDVVYLAAYFKEQVNGAQIVYRVRSPFGAIHSSWTQEMVANYYASHWYWTFQVPLNAVSGTWTFEADYAGETFVRPFYVNQEPSSLFEHAAQHLDIYPNPAQDVVNITLPADLSQQNRIEVQVRDVLGKLVSTQLLSPTDVGLRLDVSDLNSSLYLIRIMNGSSSYSAPVMVEH